MNLKIVGTGCDKCDSLFANTKEAVAKLGLDATVTKVEDLVEIVKLGIMTVPALTRDGKVLLMGKTATTEQIIKLLQK